MKSKKAASLIIICTIIVVVIVLILSILNKSSDTQIIMSSSNKSSMKLTSPAFADGAMIPVLYTCKGNEISPPLEISGIPAGTKSLALILEDPDAPAGTWDHWVAFNIDPKTTTIPEGAASTTGTLGSNTGGNAAYESPCPPFGMHRYIFTLYALSTTLSLSEGSSKSAVTSAMNGDVLGIAELMGKFGE
jgi:Raf kinase inhibitor-like YbhB/YbcL family protein